MPSPLSIPPTARSDDARVQLVSLVVPAWNEELLLPPLGVYEASDEGPARNRILVTGVDEINRRPWREHQALPFLHRGANGSLSATVSATPAWELAKELSEFVRYAS